MLIAGALVLVLAGAPHPYARQLEQARVPLPAQVTIDSAPCPDNPAHACTGQFTRRIWMRGKGRWTLYHEVGHQFDYQRLDDSRRWRFRQLIHDDRSWRSYWPSPHEQFAEAYAYCASSSKVRRKRIWGQNGLAYGLRSIVFSPSMKKVCALIRSDI